MSPKWKIMCAALAGSAIGIVVGCQRYDFEPVVPLAVSQTTQAKTVSARTSKANVVLAVDESGSMMLPIDPSNANCRFSDGGICGTDPSAPCPPSCATRTSELKRAMNTFFTANGTVARFGLWTFPSPSGPEPLGCNPGYKRVDIPQSNDVDSELQAAANQVNSTIQSDTVGGGTPVSTTLALMGNYAPLQDPNRPNFIVLETDGVPNCNNTNAWDGCDTPVQCQCSEDVGGGGACCPSQQEFRPLYRKRGCLDLDGPTGTLAVLSNLANSGAKVRTFVIGFGPDALADTLNRMAEAGGVPRTCPDAGDGPCGAGNTCNRATGRCVTEYYKAANGNELGQALDDIRKLVVGDLCVYTLEDTPSDPTLLSVIINGQPTRPGPDTWNFVMGPPTVVTFVGALCQQIRNSTPSTAVRIEFRILRSL